MLSSTALGSSASTSAADAVIEEILQEISVPMAVLEEAKRRRELVLSIAMQHDAARECLRLRFGRARDS
jgi:hypothetical protein